jgi:hypothetical protein
MKRYRSEKYLWSVRGRPCLICHQEGEAHHITYAEPNGTALKVGDNWVVPMCHKHHMELHAFGDERLWWALQGVDPIPKAEELFKEFNNG